MAGIQIPTAHSQSENMNIYVLKCTNCEKTAVELLLLKCQHRMCQECVDKSCLGDSCSLTCSSCGQTESVPVDGFPVCRLSSLLRRQQAVSDVPTAAKASDTQCELCAGEIDCKCLECSKLLCGRCSVRTICTASTKRQRHNVENIDDILKKTAEDYEAWKQNTTNEVSNEADKAKLQELLALQKRHDEKITLLNAAEKAYNSNISIADKMEIVRQLAVTQADDLQEEVCLTTASLCPLYKKGSHPTKVACVHERSFSHAYEVLGYDDGVPLVFCKEDGSVVTLNKGITLQEKTKVDFLNSGTDHIYHQRTGLQVRDSSNQTIMLCSLSLDEPNFQGERNTQFKLPLNTTEWVFENDSVIYGFVDAYTLVKYSVQTGQVLGVVDTQLQLSSFSYPTLSALQQGFLIVTRHYGPKQLQKVVADEVKWTCSLEGLNGIRNTVVENGGILYFVAWRSQYTPVEYSLIGVNSATGKHLFELKLPRDGSTNWSYAVCDDRFWQIIQQSPYTIKEFIIM